MALIITVSIILTLLVVNELWHRTHKSHNELSRKFIHITVGSFVSFWPYFMTWNQIRFMSLAFLVVIGISKYFNVFKAIHSVTRPTWGEVYFAIAVGAVTFITQTVWVYTAALLIMSLADGLAAIIGVKYGKRNSYKILGQVKSVAGTATFITVSILILGYFNTYYSTDLSLALVVSLSLIAGMIENAGVYGLDNLLVPVLSAAVLGLAIS